MTPNNRLTALVATTVVLVSATVAEATLAIAAPFEDKVENAAAIVLGKCVKTESRIDPSGRWILTYSTFQIEKSIKGSAAGSQVTIVTPGGQVGSTRQATVGVPEFHEGDENVLFVKNTQAGPTVLYFDQGAYDVSTDSHGEKIIAPVATNVVRIDAQRGVAVASELPRTLRSFEDNVGDTLAASHQRHMQYEMIQAKQRQQASLGAIVSRYRWLIAAAALGAALATWQLLRR
jgi:hypothetical protein